MIAGRKRKSGNRHPGGKLVQNQRTYSTGRVITQDNLVPPPAQIKRADALVMDMAKDAKLGTILGWMLRRKEITPIQMSAGLAFAKLFIDHAHAIASPRRYPASASLEPGGGYGGGPEDEDQTNEARRAYADVSKILADAVCLKIAIAVCVDDQAPAWIERGILHRSLEILVDYFRLDRTGGNRLPK